jgi:hypothetical protein
VQFQERQSLPRTSQQGSGGAVAARCVISRQVSPYRIQLLGRELPLLQLLKLVMGGEIPPDELDMSPDEQLVPAPLPPIAAAVQS